MTEYSPLTDSAGQRDQKYSDPHLSEIVVIRSEQSATPGVHPRPCVEGLEPEVRQFLVKASTEKKFIDLLGAAGPDEALQKLIDGSTFIESREGRKIFSLASLEPGRQELLDMAYRLNTEIFGVIETQVSESGRCIFLCSYLLPDPDRMLRLKEKVTQEPSRTFVMSEDLVSILSNVSRSREGYVDSQVAKIQSFAANSPDDPEATKLLAGGIENLRENLLRIFYGPSNQIAREEAALGLNRSKSYNICGLDEERTELQLDSVLDQLHPDSLKQLTGSTRLADLSQDSRVLLATKLIETPWIALVQDQSVLMLARFHAELSGAYAGSDTCLVPVHVHPVVSTDFPTLTSEIAERQIGFSRGALERFFDEMNKEGCIERELEVLRTEQQTLAEKLRLIEPPHLESLAAEDPSRALPELRALLAKLTDDSTLSHDDSSSDGLVVHRGSDAESVEQILGIVRKARVQFCEGLVLVEAAIERLESTRDDRNANFIERLLWSEHPRVGTFGESAQDANMKQRYHLSSERGGLVPELLSVIDNPFGRLLITSYLTRPETDFTIEGVAAQACTSFSEYRIGHAVGEGWAYIASRWQDEGDLQRQLANSLDRLPAGIVAQSDSGVERRAMLLPAEDQVAGLLLRAREICATEIPGSLTFEQKRFGEEEVVLIGLPNSRFFSQVAQERLLALLPGAGFSAEESSNIVATVERLHRAERILNPGKGRSLSEARDIENMIESTVTKAYDRKYLSATEYDAIVPRLWELDDKPHEISTRSLAILHLAKQLQSPQWDGAQRAALLNAALTIDIAKLRKIHVSDLSLELLPSLVD